MNTDNLIFYTKEIGELTPEINESFCGPFTKKYRDKVNKRLNAKLTKLGIIINSNEIPKEKNKLKKGNKAIVFDIDGVLIEAGLEVGDKSDKTVEEYIENNKETISEVQNILKELEKNGFQITLCTGRGDNFARKIGDNVLGGNYSRVISEGGVLIGERDGKSKPFNGLEKNAYFITNIKDDLIKFVLHQNGFFEEGKEYVLSFNPPEGENIDQFKKKIIQYLSEKYSNFNNYLLITNSQTAVDILPKGADKNIALLGTLPDTHLTYFGDSNNDLTALKISDIGIIPQNAKDPFKKEVNYQNQDKITLHAKGNEIEGVKSGLEFLKELIK